MIINRDLDEDLEFLEKDEDRIQIVTKIKKKGDFRQRKWKVGPPKVLETEKRNMSKK